MTRKPITWPPIEMLIAAREAARLAALGQAPGQCAECGSFRLDGKPPYLHRDGCTLEEPIEDSTRRFFRELDS